MSIAQLRAFHSVATAGGFSQAAREIAISQPTLSGQVRQLEQLSGTTLFERRQRGVELTAEGEALFEVTRRLFEAEAEARTLLKDDMNRLGGHLRVVADGAFHSVPIIRHLNGKRPRLTFSLAVANSERVIAHLLEYRADVGVTACLAADPRLHLEPLLESRMGAFVSRDHQWTGRDHLVMKDLQDQPFVMRERGSRTRAVFEENLAQHDVGLGQIMEVSTQEGVREAAAAGFGIGISADIEFGHDSRLHFLPILDADILLIEYVTCLAERRRLPLVRDFFESAADLYGSISPRAARSPAGPEAA
ncbi:LysR substrate-binding domain-containing protein [Terrihabitans rhizophilus]|uniref:LysR substrate-binding domain-containing protein n=1 Tax=Terrihabitans rhizophilus TaxID=3092662 RepID=A0ABU4RK55_9HYPH|nr:LysR substrate-binding domain-containing protein [Terrihabitans sp. PJ23]MDX6804956.1 LysR substrate-binding domain-containing protein [Terrihabitans sp. PJ23]